jgi:hypothetical protein
MGNHIIAEVQCDAALRIHLGRLLEEDEVRLKEKRPIGEFAQREYSGHGIGLCTHGGKRNSRRGNSSRQCGLMSKLKRLSAQGAVCQHAFLLAMSAQDITFKRDECHAL